MLKTNSKQAKENIKKYIIDGFTPEGYTDTAPDTWHGIATFIYDCFCSEKWSIKEDFQYYGGNEQKAFLDWCSGLPSVLDTCYYYNRSAVEDLGKLLEETETEKARFTESEAERMLSILIYQTIKKEITKNVCTQN